MQLKVSQCHRNGIPYGRPYVHHTVKKYFVAVLGEASPSEYKRIKQKGRNFRYTERINKATNKGK